MIVRLIDPDPMAYETDEHNEAAIVYAVGFLWVSYFRYAKEA